MVEHIRKRSAEWQQLKKCINRNSTKDFLTNQQMFEDHLDGLFSIACHHIMSLIKTEKDCFWMHSERKVGEYQYLVQIETSQY